LLRGKPVEQGLKVGLVEGQLVGQMAKLLKLRMRERHCGTPFVN
jgi:hypothetical protein